MNIVQLLDEAKAAQGFETDMALAKALGISRSAVSAWRNGQKTPDPVQSAALAGYTGIPLARVLGIVGEARAISREEKAVWRKLAATAAALVLFAGYTMPAQAQAHEKTLENKGFSADNLYIMRNIRRGASLAIWPTAFFS